jgi:hypothetical protein
MGHIIPAGTGFDYHRKAQLKPLVEFQTNRKPRNRRKPRRKTRCWPERKWNSNT